VFADMALNNRRLKRACRKLHCELVAAINASSVLDHLIARGVISADDEELLQMLGSTEKCRRMLSFLHVGQHPRAFIKLYAVMKKEPAYKHLTAKIHLLSKRRSSPKSHRSRRSNAHSASDLAPFADRKNIQLERACDELRQELEHTINASSSIDELFARRIIREYDYQKLLEINGRTEKSRRMLDLLHTCHHPTAFVELYAAIKKEPAYQHLTKKIYLLSEQIDPRASSHCAHQSLQLCRKSAVLETRFVVSDESPQSILRQMST
jgi:hypothetical protein